MYVRTPRVELHVLLAPRHTLMIPFAIHVHCMYMCVCTAVHTDAVSPVT